MKEKGKWSVLTVLAMAAFIMVIDSTAMNVSISNLVADLNTNVTTIQTIMSLYTLIMAVFMLPGAKAADIFGKKKIFLIGVSLYGVGTLTAAIAPNTTVLFIGWAVLEGLASSMMMPTALSLITSAYEGKDRAVAMSIYTAMSSVALAIGPIFGGLITTYLSWRFVFALEVLIVIYIIIRNKTIRSIDCPEGDRTQKLDIPGTIICMLALLSIISGALLSSTYGWFTPKTPFSLLGITIEGISITFILLCLGVVLIALLIWWLSHAKKKGKPVLIDLAIFKSRLYNSVLLINFFVQISLMGIMFITSIYLQNLLKYDALHTGLTLLPLSILLFVVALIAAKLAEKIPPRYIIAVGGLAIFAGALIMFIQLSSGEAVTGIRMLPSMALVGIGIGCTLSLTGNIGLSDIDPSYANQGSGMITTVNNFGSSMSTAVIGSMLSGGIAGGVVNAFISRYPETFGSMTHAEAAMKLEEAFNKIKVMDIKITDLPAEQASNLKAVIVNGVDNAMMPIYIVIMAMAIIAAVVAFFLLKKKKL